MKGGARDAMCPSGLATVKTELLRSIGHGHNPTARYNASSILRSLAFVRSGQLGTLVASSRGWAAP